MGWLIALAVIVAVLWIPLGVTASYDESGAVVKLVLGFLRFQLYPGKPKEKKEEPKKEQKPAPGKPAAPKEEKKGGSVSDFFPLVDVVLDFLSDIRRKLRVDLLEIRFCMAGGDPARQKSEESCWLVSFFNEAGHRLPPLQATKPYAQPPKALLLLFLCRFYKLFSCIFPPFPVC